jgi:hypothetical protein
MTLTDLEPGPREVIEVMAVAPTVIQIAVTVLIGVVPRVLALSLPPDATIADAEVTVRSRVNLGDLQLEFALMETATESIATLAKSTPVASLDLSHLTLVARPAGACSYENSGKVHDAPEPSFPARSALPLNGRSGWAHSIACSFHCDQPSDDFQLSFSSGATIGEAREEIAQRYGKSAPDVELYFMGKALRDGFLLSRLKIEHSGITIRLADDSEILVLTARANFGCR